MTWNGTDLKDMSPEARARRREHRRQHMQRVAMERNKVRLCEALENGTRPHLRVVAPTREVEP